MPKLGLNKNNNLSKLYLLLAFAWTTGCGNSVASAPGGIDSNTPNSTSKPTGTSSPGTLANSAASSLANAGNLPHGKLSLEEVLPPPPAAPSSKIPLVQITITTDPVYGYLPKSYDAHKLQDVVSLVPDAVKIDEAAKVEKYALVLTALDRYRVVLPYDKIKSGKGYVARKMKGYPDSAPWDPIPAQAQVKTPAPYYMVWDIESPDLENFPTPYQLAYLELVPYAVLYTDAVPTKASASAGFRRYMSMCISCHSVNYSGGRSHGEFNVPTNLTERSNADGIKMDFARFTRHLHNEIDYGRSRPGCTYFFPSLLSADDVKDIWEYLLAMKDQKICQNEAACKAFASK